MKYQKPQIVVYGEMDVAEWAISKKDLSAQRHPLVACKCTMGQAKALAPVEVACHCANGGARVSYKASELSTSAVKVA